VHLAVPLVQVQAWAQVPQLFTSVLRLASQPVKYCPSQSAYPALHEPTLQLPPEQPGVPLATWHAVEQVPQ